MRPLVVVMASLALSGCFLLPSGEPSRVGEVPEEMRRSVAVAPPVADRHPYGDVAKLAVGQWARYRDGGGVITLAVVGRQDDGVWIEVVEEGEPRMVSARLVAPDGVVKRAFYGEALKGTAVPQPLRQWAPPQQAVLREAGRETGTERCAVGGRELTASVVRIRYEDLDGRLFEEISLWHPDVPPVYAGGDLGGLVRRRSGPREVELLDFGAGARPLLEIPR